MREEIERRTAAGETVGVMDQMRIVKQRLLEMIPELSIFLDVDGKMP